MKKYNNYDLHFNFEVKDGLDYLNVEYIHPLKQDTINRLLQYFKKDTNIKTVIIFGSSVDFSCNSYSDLDICLERYDADRNFKIYLEDMDEETDIVYMDSIGDRLKSEIEEKGIVVFDREGQYV